MIDKLKYLMFVLLMINLSGYAVVPSNRVRLAAYLFDQVIIHGTTNIKQFQLSYSEKQYTEISADENISTEYMQLAIPAQEIKAESKVMLDDFLELINAEEHPAINISMNDDLTDDLRNDSSFKHQIKLSMNGVTNSYFCLSNVEKCYPDQWCLSGKLGVRLTDFGIEPPKKYLGIVKVGDEVFISFRILFSTDTKETKN